MYYYDNKQHNLPHIHVEYQEDKAIIGLPDGDLIEGHLPSSKMKLVQAWIEIQKENLMADWKLAKQGEKVFNIDPLK